MNAVFSVNRQHQPHQPVSQRDPGGDRVRRYECSHCQRSFSRSEHLKRHERGHTNERPFKCLHCRRAFVRRDILSRHSKSFHPDLEELDSSIPDAAARTTVLSKSPVVSATDQMPHGSTSPSSYSSPSYGDSPLPTTLEPTKRTSEMNDLSHQTPSMPPPQPRIQIESPGQPCDDNSMSNDTVVVASQQHPHVRSTAHLNNHQTTSFDDVDTSWTEGHQDISDNHFSYDATAINPAVVNGTLFDGSGFQDSYSPIYSHSADFLSTLIFQPTNDKSVSLQPNAMLFPSASPRTNQNLYRSSTHAITASGEGDRSQNALPIGKQDPSWMQRGNNGVHSSGKGMLYAEKLQTLYPLICPDIDALPTTNAFLRYTDFYFKYYSPHLPFLRKPSFDLWSVFPGLAFSVASIGAIYAAEHETAFDLHCISKRLLKQFEEETAFSKSKPPLGSVQAQLLNMMFAAWSGDARGAKYASSLQSSVVANAKQLVKDAEKDFVRENKPGRVPDRNHEYEEVKRLFYAVYLASASFSSAFGENPLLFNHDCLSIRLPCQEEEWAQERQSSQGTLFTASIAPMTLGQALSILSKGQKHEFSSFQIRILIAAVYVEFWQAACHSPASADDGQGSWKDRIHQLLEAWNTCFHSGSRRRVESTSICELMTMETSLEFDALALYRHIKVGLVYPLRHLAQQFSENDAAAEAIASALWCLRSQVHRSSEMTKVMSHCLETLQLPLSRGARFIARTGPLYWGVEHVPLGSILCVLLCLWTSRFNESGAPPINEMEESILDQLITMLRDAGFRPRIQNLPSMLAGIWETMLDSSCYVWMVTPEYAKVYKSFRQHSAEDQATPCADGS